jgi:DNA-binding transcriptional LysR family regulator
MHSRLVYNQLCAWWAAMDVEALRTFLAIYQAGGVTAAAETLYRSQPAVSRRLALLERDLGVRLFERVPGGVVLSEAGRALLPYAEMTLAIMRDTEAAVRAVHSDDSGAVTIALVGTLAGTNLTSALRRFAQRHPNVDVRLRTATSREVSVLVRRADVTFGLRYAHDPAPEIRSEMLFSERWVVAAAPDHPLAGVMGATLNALASERWIAFPDQPDRPESSARYIRLALDSAHVDETRILRIDSLTAQKRLVEAGFGIAILPESSIQEELSAGSLVVLNLDDLAVEVPVTVVTRKNGYLSAAAQTLLKEIREAGGNPTWSTAPAHTDLHS